MEMTDELPEIGRSVAFTDTFAGFEYVGSYDGHFFQSAFGTRFDLRGVASWHYITEACKNETFFQLTESRPIPNENGNLEYHILDEAGYMGRFGFVVGTRMRNFRTLEQAEACIKRLSENDIKKHNHLAYCYSIKEVPLDIPFGYGEWFEHVYLGNGKPWVKNRTALQNNCNQLFRSAEKYSEQNIGARRFKEGDIVEVKNGNIIELGIVYEVPQLGFNYGVIHYVKLKMEETYVCWYPSSVDVFAPSLQVPEDIQMKLQECLQRKKTLNKRKNIS